jgi:hypothetical protein
LLRSLCKLAIPYCHIPHLVSSAVFPAKELQANFILRTERSTKSA